MNPAMSKKGLAPDPPLYFLHIPRTGGTSFSAELDNHFAAEQIFPGRLLCQLACLAPETLAPFRFFRGHLGTVLPDLLSGWVRTVTVVRNPLDTVLSLFAFASRVAWHPLHRKVIQPGYGVSEFLRDPECRALTSNWQARWLAAEPPPGDLAWATIPPSEGLEEWRAAYHLRPLELGEDDLLARAGANLDRCEVVGVTERLDETLESLARVMGWPKAGPVTKRNVSTSRIGPADLTAPDRRYAGQLNQVDAELHRRAALRIQQVEDGATAVAVPPPALVDLPYDYDWSMPLRGHGWYDRTFDPRVGWYRWTGPGTDALLELPVAGGTRAELAINVVCAVTSEVLAGMVVSVEGRPLTLSASAQGIVTVLRGVIDLPSAGPLRLTFSVPHTESLGSIGPLFDPWRRGGVAIARVRLAPTR